ncbi:lanC-like protein 3 [Ylistrum balloti]|uniref:lanC-like protein 3 n=1 Tax=Ylistrum balloti TaxID=509963 RepID=UPI002905E98D|nr:lanC-like protein 3 [Ylistrum balloti]
MRYFKNRYEDYKEGSEVYIDQGKWKASIEQTVKSIVHGMPPNPATCDGGLYVGNAGVAYMFYYLSNCDLFSSHKAYFLEQGMMYVKVAMDYVERGGHRGDPPCSFILGSAGTMAVYSLLFHIAGNESKSKKLAEQFAKLADHARPIAFYRYGSDELLVGRAGYLSGALALQQKLGYKAVDEDTLKHLCTVTVESGRHYSYSHKPKSPKGVRSPLMYAYHGTEYLGAAHGLSGILQMLLSFPEFYTCEDSQMAVEDVHKAVDFMLSLEQTNHNYAPAMDEVGRGRPEGEDLVHWCHGAPGVIYLFARAYKVWGDEKYLQACVRCGELTWEKGLLRKGPGICHGVAGSGYVFLLLYRLTADKKYLYRALKFAEFMFTQEFMKGARVPDMPFSLYEGWAGAVLFLVDLMQPDKAEFPLFNVVF